MTDPVCKKKYKNTGTYTVRALFNQVVPDSNLNNKILYTYNTS